MAAWRNDPFVYKLLPLKLSSLISCLTLVCPVDGRAYSVATSKKDNTLVMDSNKFLLSLTLPSGSHEKFIDGCQGSDIRKKSTITRKEEINMQNVTFSKTNVLLRQMVKRLSQKQAVI